MKRIVFIIMACLFFMNIASAEISRHYSHAERTFDIISSVSSKYDDDMNLNIRFTKEYKLDHGDKHIAYSLSINFDPSDENKLMKSYEFFKDGFLYSLEGDPKMRTGKFLSITDPGIGRSSHYVDVEMNESTPGRYSVKTERSTFQYGGNFYTLYNNDMAFYRKYKMKQLELAFYDDLMAAIRDNKELTLQIPYAQNLSNVDKIEFITFKISKATLREWNDVVKFDLKSELQKLNTINNNT